MKILSLLPILMLVSPLAMAGSNDHLAEDSVNIVLELTIDPKIHEEKRVSAVSEVRLYTTGDRTVLLWSDGGDFYLYTLRGAGHEERGMALLRPIAAGDMVSYVFERAPRRTVKFSRYFEVIGLQLKPVVATR